MQNILTLETKKYSLKLENFEGPLDLLCHLVDKNKMNINEVNKWIFSYGIYTFVFKIKKFTS